MSPGFSGVRVMLWQGAEASLALPKLSDLSLREERLSHVPEGREQVGTEAEEGSSAETQH